MKKVALIMFLCILSKLSLASNDNMQRRKANLFLMLKGKMDYSLQRHQVLSENIASQDIPRYRAKDLKEVDVRKIGAGHYKNSIGLNTTNAGHLNFRGKVNSFKTYQKKLDQRTTIMENNVDIPEQMIKVTENMSDYNLATSIYKKMTGLVKLSIGR